MALPFLGEIRLLPYNFAPKTWAYCSGQLLSVNQNQALFSLFGTTYGGDGQQTFALPDLRGRTATGQGVAPGGGAYTQGQKAGTENVTLLGAQLPVHTHSWMATSDPANSAPPTNNVFGSGRLAGAPLALYAPPGTGTMVTLAPTTIGMAGSNVPHNNMQPYLALAYCVALQGIYPSRS